MTQMTLQTMTDLLRAARTCRRFVEDTPLPPAALRHIVDAARVASSCVNRQPLRYYTVSDPEIRGRIFPGIRWAGALPDWNGPAEGERPTGYIVICSAQPANMFVYYDIGIAAQSMQLCATAMGLGCCMINNFAKDAAREILGIPDTLEVMLLLALGAPREVRRIEDAVAGDSLTYWRDEQNVHHVPKLMLDQVLLAEK
ncbi:Nitroreductase [uncultured delta proteobacterium]|uniref:Nitroreductase n=1 Tax=uncultured delta proteobacterium TaxID=34034 RepID=A0A212KB70_9DELT|nr:Nitroreductase [uncultured delta proteobacterium]